ncbi:dTDP-4-dehydrorhamnose 3,5-epimerase family protein [Candidatus Berkelbacteria bacterium]|nr:dTDP-4-dehydrorhamnose 3,5-epimerase family protein [Candidatus Berkelbacteria bacterium]MBI4029756.1 dTDP-4-dehydrorhamnose 3,5-epimerase family protein [Candidatus Berkelbacteria bacterium]
MLKNILPKVLTQYQKKITRQEYTKKPSIEGIKIIELKNFSDEGGFLCEMARVDENGFLEGYSDFKIAQINYSEALPGVVKAWHLHFNQEDIWYIAPYQNVLVGLYDLRKNSSTREVSMRLSLGGGKSQLLYIPRGVAHGYANLSNQPISIFYLVNQKFNPESPDEYRLPWDILGKDFWEIKKS